MSNDIERWDMVVYRSKSGSGASLESRRNGEWVKFDDHFALIEELKFDVNEQQEKIDELTALLQFAKLQYNK